jgi:hypothetical protein
MTYRGRDASLARIDRTRDDPDEGDVIEHVAAVIKGVFADPPHMAGTTDDAPEPHPPTPDEGADTS